MKTEFKKMSLSRALTAGAFSGIITALFIITYTYFYREATDFEKITSIGPVTIFIGIPLLMVIAGSIYFILVHYLLKGELIYITLFSLAVIAGILFTLNLQASGTQKVLTQPEGLVFGIIIITGIAVCIFFPYLAHHPRIYMTKDQMDWEK